MDYWESSECRKHFGISPDECVRTKLEKIITLLKSVSPSCNGYKNIVAQHDINQEYSEYDVWVLHQKYMLLCAAYYYALQLMNQQSWVNGCCVKYIEHCGIIVVTLSSNHKTIAIRNQ